MTEATRRDYLNEEAKRLQGRIQELFLEWRRDPGSFTFCQSVRSVHTFSLSRGRGPSIDDGSTMMEAIATRVCGDRWEYVVHSTLGGDPVCVITRKIGDRND